MLSAPVELLLVVVTIVVVVVTFVGTVGDVDICAVLPCCRDGKRRVQSTCNEM